MKKNILKIFIFVTVIVMLVSIPVSAGAKTAAEIFVAPYGSDENSGSISSPLLTLAAAKETAKTISGDVTVYFREGSYTFNETVCFDSADKSNVTYKSYNGEKVVFTSGTAYSDFEECTVNGVRAFRKNIGTGADFNVLFNSETTLNRTRYPENGYFYIKKVDSKFCVNPESSEDCHLAYTGMYCDKKDVPALKNTQDIIVRILHYWKDEIMPVKSYNASTGEMQFTKPTSMQLRDIDRYFLENVFESLNEPGEWYLDKPAGVLYYVPFEGEKADEITLWGSETVRMISVSGVDGISFEGIVFRGNGFKVSSERDFSQAAYDAEPCLFYEAANGFSVKNCEFRDIAGGCVFMGSCVKNAEVDSCYFENIGAQAVYVRGENVPVDSERVTKDIKINNNCVSGYGRVYYNAVAMLVIHANSVEITNNEIHDGYYTAVSVGWVWGYAYTVSYDNKVCNNLIYNIGQGWLSDMGGIYTLGNQPGTVLSGNVIHNVAADPGQGGYGGWGIYPDEGSSYMLIENNLVYACGSDAYHLHYGSYNTVRNNIFALSGDSQIRVNSNPDRVTPKEGGKETALFENNIILTDGRTAAFSAMQSTEAFDDKNNIVWDISNGDELYFCRTTDLKNAMSLGTAKRKDYITSVITVNPGFRDAKNFDFALADDSAAVKNGFERFDYSSAGTLKGTTVGISYEGGSTAYNASASAVPMNPAREKGHFFVEIFNRFWFMLKRVFGNTVFSKMC